MWLPCTTRETSSTPPQRGWNLSVSSVYRLPLRVGLICTLKPHATHRNEQKDKPGARLVPPAEENATLLSLHNATCACLQYTYELEQLTGSRRHICDCACARRLRSEARRTASWCQGRVLRFLCCTGLVKHRGGAFAASGMIWSSGSASAALLGSARTATILASLNLPEPMSSGWSAGNGCLACDICWMELAVPTKLSGSRRCRSLPRCHIGFSSK